MNQLTDQSKHTLLGVYVRLMWAKNLCQTWKLSQAPQAEYLKYNFFGTAAHLAEYVIKLNFLMSCNFYFT